MSKRKKFYSINKFRELFDPTKYPIRVIPTYRHAQHRPGIFKVILPMSLFNG